jgi:hypothetical protein
MDEISALSHEKDWTLQEYLSASYKDENIQEELKAATSAYDSASATADESNIAAAKSVLDQATARAILARANLMETERLLDVFEEKKRLYNLKWERRI